MNAPNTFKKLIKECHVEIPLLQRDYAQGRKNSKTDAVRGKFVKELFKALLFGERLELDFIYGPIKDGVFIPLDGQQRLTTLFLLHWYIAKQEGNADNLGFTKFTYKVRTTTQEFLDALLSQEIALDESPSEVIKDAPWYYSAWDVDPSVQGMLTMLDAIHSEYRKLIHKSADLWDSLDNITFNLLDMGEFGLTDDLYMKMNARGVPLTDFENFKAWLEQKTNEENLSLPADWKTKMDKDWCDLFWNYCKGEDGEGDPKKVDEAYLRFFKMVALNAYVSKSTEDGEDVESKRDDAKTIAKNTGIIHDENIYIPLDDYDKIFGLLNEDGLKAAFRVLDNVGSVEWDKLDTQFFQSNKNLFQCLCSYKFKNYNQRLFLFGAFLWLSKSTAKSEQLDSFDEWMRVVRNLTLNSNLSAGTYANAVKGLENLFLNSIDHKEGVLGYLVLNGGHVNGVNETNKIEGFSNDQIAEERLKAKLMTGDNCENWKKVIVAAENHSLFRGQIGFLFQAADGMKIKVAELEFSLVQKRWENAEQYFTVSGVAAPFAKDALLMRAYISRMDQWGQLFGIPYSNGHDTWREVILKVKNGKSEKLAPLLPLLEIDPINNSLKQLEEWITEDSNISALETPRKRVHHDLYKTLLLVRAEDQSYLKGWDDEGKALSKFIYHLMPYNAKADWKKVAIGMQRNKILAELIKTGKVKSKDKLDDLPFFRRSSVTFLYNNKKYCWDWHDQIYLENREKTLVLREHDVTEETLNEKNILALLDQFESIQQV